MTAKSRIKSITLDRQEGVRAQWKASTISGANRVLGEWSMTAPKEGGYDKVAVTIEWENGTKHQQRIDIKHPSTGELVDVQKDLVHFVDFALGRQRNPNWSDKQHEQVMARYKANGAHAIAMHLDQNCLLADN